MNHWGTQELETERMILRRIKAEDYKQMYEKWACKEECSRFFPWSSATDMEAYKNKVLNWVDSYKDGLYFNWLIELKESKESIGIINLHDVDAEQETAETSFILAPEHWGKGLMTEALQCVLWYAFESLELKRVCADVFKGNVASEKVLEKCGFRREAVVKEKYVKDGNSFDATLYGVFRM